MYMRACMRAHTCWGPPLGRAYPPVPPGLFGRPFLVAPRSCYGARPAICDGSRVSPKAVGKKARSGGTEGSKRARAKPVPLLEQAGRCTEKTLWDNVNGWPSDEIQLVIQGGKTHRGRAYSDKLVWLQDLTPRPRKAVQAD